MIARVQFGSFVVLLACASALAFAATGPAASSSVVVSMTVPSAVTLDTTACRSGVAGTTDFGTVLPGTSAVTTGDCRVRFGSSNDTARLRIGQQDSVGKAAWAYGTGALDTAFDGDSGTGNGRVLVSPGAGVTEIMGMVRQPDGKLVLAGQRGYSDMWVARLLADGKLDTTFGCATPPCAGMASISASSGQDETRGMALQPDGRILLVGVADVDPTAGVNFDGAVVRLLANGTLDPAFDGNSGTGNGVVTLPVAEIAFNAVVRTDGSIVVVGENGAGGGTMTMTALASDGRTVTGFGTSGTVSVVTGSAMGMAWYQHWTLAEQPDGKLVAAGVGSGTGNDVAVVRADAAGVLDPTFDGDSGTGNGLVKVNVTGDDLASGIVVQPDGKLVVSAIIDMSVNYRGALVRLHADGRLDTGFAGTGKAIVPDITNNTESFNEVFLQGDGKLLVLDDSDGSGPPGGLGWNLLRYTSAGLLDATFDGDGILPVPMPVLNVFDDPVAAVAGADGRIIVAGTQGDGGTRGGAVVQLAPGSNIDDYATATNHWTTPGGSLFGACLRDVTGATAAWTVNAGNTCPATTGAYWNPVPADTSIAGATIATTAAPTTAATVDLRFGLRAATAITPGTYVAPVSIEVIAPS